MSKKPIFSATHPRACSSAFERVFLTRHDIDIFHEPFGDPYYHGKEMLGKRYMQETKCSRTESYPEFDQVSYNSVFDEILTAAEGKPVFIKDMAQYIVPPDDQATKIAPSLVQYKRGVGTAEPTNKATPFPYPTEAEPGNPTIVPDALLRKFRFAFLIRHPRSSIPSYVRCCVPPQSDKTGFPYFMPSEAGYAELVKLFDYLRSTGQIGPKIAQHVDAIPPMNGTNGGLSTNGDGDSEAQDICVIDADDMLDDPEGIIRTYCRSVGVEFQPSMLRWDNERDQRRATEIFEKWAGWHDDALESTRLKKREHKRKVKTDEQLFEEWTKTYGEEQAKVIRQTVEENVPHYEYLKQFAVKPHEPNLPQ